MCSGLFRGVYFKNLSRKTKQSSMRTFSSYFNFVSKKHDPRTISFTCTFYCSQILVQFVEYFSASSGRFFFGFLLCFWTRESTLTANLQIFDY